MLTHNTINESLDLTRGYTQGVDTKPRGLWYALDNDWLRWLRAEQMDWVQPNDFLLEIDKSRMIVLNTYEDYIQFTHKYIKPLCDGIYICIDWIKVAEDYAGIEMPSYDRVRRTTYSFNPDNSLDWIRGWDVKSGCIWDLSIISKSEIISV